MPSLNQFCQQNLEVLAAKHLLRFRHTAEVQGVRILRGGREYLSFSGNDYLGLRQHPKVVAAAVDATQKYGAGAGASSLVTGYHPLQEALEQKLAAMKGTDAALVMGSGYMANLGIIPALVGPNDLILADRLIHACMLDGARLSGATLMRFAHNSADHCRMLLEANRTEHQRCLILTETVFSMDGDVAPLAALSEVAAAFDAWLLTDDAHGIGIVNPEVKAHIQMGTLSKAVGAYGGYVCADAEVIQWLENAARTAIFSTALPPGNVAAALASLEIITAEPERGEQALANARQFTEAMEMPEAQSCIVPFILGEAEAALNASQLLEEEGILISPIRPPAVPPGTARLRIAFSALHTPHEVEQLVNTIRKRGLKCVN